MNKIVGYAIAAIAVVLLVVGAYFLGKREAAPPQAGPAGLGPGQKALAPNAVAPPSHANLDMRPPAAKEPVQQATGRDLKFTHFRVGNSNVKSILADGDIVWVGTSGGVIRYDTTSGDYRLFDVRSGLLSNGVFHLSKMGDRLVVGTYGGGLSIYDPTDGTWANYNIQHGLGDAFVYDFLQTSNGDIWIATWSGANRIRGGRLDDRQSWETFTVKNTDGGLPNDWVYGLAEGENGDVWLATEGGVALYRDGVWRHWTHKEGLGAPYEQVKDQIEFKRDPAKESSHHARQKAEQGLGQVDIAYNPNYVVSMLVDGGTVWAGTWGGGLSRFDGEQWTNYTAADGLPGNHVFMLDKGPDGKLWIGTGKGLVRKDGDSYTRFTMADGLFAENVFSMAITEGGTGWIGSFGGVARIQGLADAE